MRPRPYFDLKEHFLFLNKQVLPLFFFLCAMTMLAIVVIRSGRQGAPIPDEDFVAARIGLQRPTVGATFDPAWSVLSPIEMVLAPTATTVDEVLAPSAALFAPLPGDNALPVRARADGRVAAAAAGTMLLVHELPSGIRETLYTGLSGLRVGVGARVRRGERIGRAEPGQWRVESRAAASLALEGSGGESRDDLGLPAADRLAPPPEGPPLENQALTLEATPGTTAPPPSE